MLKLKRMFRYLKASSWDFTYREKGCGIAALFVGVLRDMPAVVVFRGVRSFINVAVFVGYDYSMLELYDMISI